MKPDSNLALWALAGLYGTAMALPIAQTPYYASRFPQHPQNLGYGGDYPKYWQGEAYNPEVAPNYNGYTGPAAAVAPETERKEQRPSFTDTKYPAREAIKHYSGTAFPGSGSGASEDSANGQNIKITNDTPSDNDKSYTRITKGPGVGLRKKKTSAKPAEEEDKEPEHRSGGLEDIADLATPRFDGTIPSEEQEEQDSNWGSFTFGVVSDSLVYHDPYENRRDEFERKTDALSKIERMMGHSFVSADDTVEKRSLGKRDWPEHIQEKALKMMDSASNMQTKGQKTIDNDPQYQASLKGGQEAPNAPEPAQSSGPKNTFPVGPNSKKAQAAQSPPPPPPPPAPAPAPPAERKLGSGGGGLVPPHKAGKVAKTKGKAPPALGNPAPPEPQQQQQPSQPMGRQQGNMPSQGRGNPQRPQERQPGAQRPKNKAQGKQRPQQNQPNLMKRQVAVPAGPGYPPGTMITRITRPAAVEAQAFAGNNQVPSGTRQSTDGQVQQVGDGQIQAFPISAEQAQIQQVAPVQQFAPVPQFAPVQRVAPVQQAAPAPVQFLAPVPVPAPAPVYIQQAAQVPAPVAYQRQQQQQQAPAQVATVKEIPVTKEQVQHVQYNTIVHPGEVICPQGKPCPPPAPPAPIFEEKTYLRPVEKVTEVEVTREAIRAVPKLEPVEVTRYVDVEKEVQVEKVVEVCETCVEKKVQVQKPKVISVCSECREAVEDCNCEGGDGNHESFSKSVSNGEETISYKSDEGNAYLAGPVSTPGGLEAFFRERMPEHFN